MTDQADAAAAEGRDALLQGKPEVAENCFREVIGHDPRRGAAWHGLGKALHDQLRLDEAEAAFARAAAVDPDPSRARYHIGLLRLLRGDHAQGWEGWEARRGVPALGLPRIDTPAWDATPLPGGKLLILGEQGFGDVIQFARFLPAAAARAGTRAHVTFGCAAPLHALLAPLCAAAGIEAVTGSVMPQHFDRFAWIGSLPRLLGATGPDAFGGAPYLAMPAERVAAWRRRRPRRAVCVGLVWEGRASHPQDATRSLTPDALAPLAEVPGVALVGLQRPPLRRAAPEGLLDLDWGPDITDFAEFAAMLSALDAVVTVDTAAAHLAGALGRPGLVLLPRVPDWRWGLGSASSAWYRSLHLLRQEQAGAWPGVVAQAAAALRDARQRR